MIPNYTQLEILSKVIPVLEENLICLDTITLYEGYIDFNFSLKNDSEWFYEYLIKETMLNFDRDSSRNAYLVRIFY